VGWECDVVSSRHLMDWIEVECLESSSEVVGFQEIVQVRLELVVGVVETECWRRVPRW